MPEDSNEKKDPALEKKVDSIIIDKIQLICAIVAFIIPIIGFFYKIQLDTALIKAEITSLTLERKDILTRLTNDERFIIGLVTIHPELK
jgi:hypothetical protein